MMLGRRTPQDDYLSLIGTSEEDGTGDDADVTRLTSHRVLSKHFGVRARSRNAHGNRRIYHVNTWSESLEDKREARSE